RSPPMTRRVIAIGLLLLTFPSFVAAQQSTTQAPPTSQGGPAPAACAPADDPDYGLTARKAVRIGGGPMYMAARQRRYLDSLRGPEGQELSFKRTGTTVTETNGQ